jgi:hypothetical protein
MRQQIFPYFLQNRFTDGDQVVSLMRGSPSPPDQEIFLVLISVRGLVKHLAIVRLERLGQLRNVRASSGIEPAAFKFVAY